MSTQQPPSRLINMRDISTTKQEPSSLSKPVRRAMRTSPLLRDAETDTLEQEREKERGREGERKREREGGGRDGRERERKRKSRRRSRLCRRRRRKPPPSVLGSQSPRSPPLFLPLQGLTVDLVLCSRCTAFSFRLTLVRLSG